MTIPAQTPNSPDCCAALPVSESTRPPSPRPKSPTCALCACLAVFLACASYKVLEQSAKERPGWINAIHRDFIVVSGEGATSQDAKRSAMAKVKEEIVSRIATKTLSNQTLNITQSQHGDQARSQETFRSRILTRSGYSDYLNGLSLSRVERYYWERIREKGNERYRYVICYPFAQRHLDSLVTAWHGKQREYSQQLGLISARQSTDYSTVESVVRDRDELRALAGSMNPSDSLKARHLESLRNQWLAVLTVETNQLGSDSLRYRLLSGGRPLRTETQPEIHSNCARVKTFALDSTTGTYALSFDHSACDCRMDNHLALRFRYGTWTLQERIELSFRDICVDFGVEGRMTNRYTKISRYWFGTAGNLQQSLRMTLRSRQSGRFVITRIDYNYVKKGMLGEKLITRRFDRIAVPCKGKDLFEVSVSRTAVEGEEPEAPGTYTAAVTVYYRNKNINKLERLELTNVPYTVLK